MRYPLLLASLLVLPACGDDNDAGDDSALPGSTSPTTGNTDDGPTLTTDSGTPPVGSTTDDPTAPGDTSDTTADPPGEDTTTGEDEPLPPTNGAELVPWLEGGQYLGWTTESAIHDSAGPHFGNVRTYVNTALLGSLEAGNSEHPIDAAAVKELYGDGDTVLGWSVIVKVQPDSAGGNGWYWYEGYETSVYADGVGKGGCTGCHSAGQDFFRSPFPLQ